MGILRADENVDAARCIQKLGNLNREIGESAAW